MFNGTKKIIDILANGTWTIVLSTGPVVYCKVKESQLTSAAAANVPQGFQYQLWQNATRDWGPTLETIPGEVLSIGDEMTQGSKAGSTIGQGPQTLGMGLPATPATPLFRAQALTAATTSLESTQFYS